VALCNFFFWLPLTLDFTWDQRQTVYCHK
jgi:hypothetical protein